MYVQHACGVRVVFLEHGALGICRSPVCTSNVEPSITSVIPFHYSLWAGVASGTARYAKRLVWTYIDPANFGGHSRYIIPPLSPSQPVIADDNILLLGKLPKFLCFLCSLEVRFFVSFSFLRFFGLCTNTEYVCGRGVSTALPRAQHSTIQSPLHKAVNQVHADQRTYRKKYRVRTCMRRPGSFPGVWSS